MKKMILLFVALLTCICFAQSTDEIIIDINNIKLPIHNNGQISKTFISGDTQFATYNNVRFLYGGGFYLSGYSNDSLWSNKILWSSDYLPGNVGSDAQDPNNKFYILKSTDKDFGNSWQEWKTAVTQGAKYYDGDNNGLYNPVDLNNNGIWDSNEDRPDLIGDYTAFCVFHHAMSFDENEFPVGIEVRQTIFGTGVLEAEILRNVLFVKYELINTGTVSELLDSVLFGVVADPDIGQLGYDDLTGCDTSFNRGYTYNSGSDPNFGDTLDTLPAFIIDLLQGPYSFIPDETFIDHNSNGMYDEGIDTPLDTAIAQQGKYLGQKKIIGAKNLLPTSFFPFNSGTGSAVTKEQIRNYLKCIQKYDGEIDPCSWIYGNGSELSNCGEINNKFVHSGDPVNSEGWLNTFPIESRMLLSTGPFRLVKDEPIEIIVAYIVGLGSDNTNSITVAREIDDYTKIIYLNNFIDFPVNIKDKEPIFPKKYLLSQNYPNPFNPTTQISYQIPKDGFVNFVVYNTLGQAVSTLVNRHQTRGKYSIQFDASNLPSGVYFYKIESGNFTKVNKMLLLR